MGDKYTDIDREVGMMDDTTVFDVNREINHI
jgi:hypothetical protein